MGAICGGHSCDSRAIFSFG